MWSRASPGAGYDPVVPTEPTVVHHPASLQGISDMGKTVIPTCPFAAAYIKRHPEWASVVAPSMRDQFTSGDGR